MKGVQCNLPAPLPGSFEERISRVRLWTLPVAIVVLGFVWSRLERVGILPQRPDWGVWGFFLVWWILEAAPGRYSLRATFGQPPQRSDWGWMVLLLFAVFGLRTAWWIGWSSWDLLLAGTIPPAFSFSLPRDSSLAAIVTTTLLAPVLEELTFRGTIFRKWRLRFGPGKAMLLSSLAFGLPHPEKVAATIMGITFVMLYARTRTLWAPVVLHSLNNAVGVAMGEWGPLRINVETWWKLCIVVTILLSSIAVWVLFVRKSWCMLGAPLPPDSLQPPAAHASSLPEPLRADG